MPFLSAQQRTKCAHISIFVFGGLVVLVGTPGSYSQTKAPDSPTFSVPVVVSDFELNSVSARPKPPGAAPEDPERAKPEVPLVYGETDVPSVQARRLMDFFAATLVQTLEKKGFSASRASRPNPPTGALVRGVFAEPDALNRIRRALLGGGSPNARFLLYVGIFNLARQEQPLYQPATNQRSDNGTEPNFKLGSYVSPAKNVVETILAEEIKGVRKISGPVNTEVYHLARQEQPLHQTAPNETPDSAYGPVITLNNYVPMAKYEMDKNPTEEEVQKICNQIAASLMALLEKNPHAFEH